MINRLEYGVQIRSIHANSSFTQKNIASKKQVENNILNEATVDKPFLVRKYVVSCSSVLLKLRRRCNGIFPACLLMDSFVKTKVLSREFSSTVEIESERFKRSILEDLKGEKWPTDCIKKRKAINDYVQSVQNQILRYKGEQQLEFIASQVFDIRNRIFSINKIFHESKSSCYDQVGYSDLTLKFHKFILLKQTKLTNLSKLPPCKIVMVEIPKANGSKRSLGISMPVDKVLQRMFLNFLDVLIEEELKPEVFAYRKGRDAKMAVASVYAKLNRAKYIEQMCLCSVDIEKCFDNFFHHQIIEQYPFPKNYSFLLSRWLTPNLIDKNRDFKNLGKVSRGVPQGSILGPSIANLLLSNAFPENILKERGKDRRKVWADISSYVDDIILIANNKSIFFRHLTQLRKNLKKIGLSLNNKKTKSFVCIKSKIKFQFLGFEFLVMPRDQLKKSPLLSNMKNLHSLKEGTKGFGIILRPSPEKVKDIKKRLKVIIKRILHQPRKEIYKSFQHINSVLLGWGSYYYFSQECIYGKRVDNYVFKYLRKILVKKFRYNGLLRPKWVAYNFLGLDKINPNEKKWQPRALQYIKNSSKVTKYVYIWYCQDSFSRLSITSFLLDSKVRKKNYYAFPDSFEKSMNKLIVKRLKSDLKVKLYDKQNGLCLVCKERMNRDLLLSRSSTLHIHHLVPRSIADETNLNKKSYESRKNKVLLHEKCHLVLHKSNLFQDSYLLRTSVPEKPIIS
jgi:RNA-directed DNA polymerase